MWKHDDDIEILDYPFVVSGVLRVRPIRDETLFTSDVRVPLKNPFLVQLAGSRFPWWGTTTTNNIAVDAWFATLSTLWREISRIEPIFT